MATVISALQLQSAASARSDFSFLGKCQVAANSPGKSSTRTGLDAALGIEDVPGKLERMVTGQADPAEYFSVFRNWILDRPGHRWYRDQVVTLLDDHDQVRKGSAKFRFCGDRRFSDLAFNVIATQLTTMGIPCIYYGSEQGFDSGDRLSGSDIVLRENMFGGRFGSHATQGRHFFDENGELYRALAALIELRKKLLPLRRGRQVLHQVSRDGVTFDVPYSSREQSRSLVSWSRLFIDQEVLVATTVNRDARVGGCGHDAEAAGGRLCRGGETRRLRSAPPWPF